MRTALAALLLLAVPAFAEGSQDRLEDILSGKSDEKKNETVGTSGSSTTSSGASSVSSVSGGSKFSVLTGRTVGNNANVLEAGVGWPGLHASFLHGVADSVDLGGRVSFNWGYEGALFFYAAYPVSPGLKLQGLFRARLMDNGKISLGLSVSPGMFFYFPSINTVQIGIVIPAALQVGIHATSALNIALGLEVPFFISFGTNANVTPWYARVPHVVVPIYAGGGLEYYVTSALLIHGSFQMGPAINAGNYGGAVFGMNAKAGVGWKF